MCPPGNKTPHIQADKLKLKHSLPLESWLTFKKDDLYIPEHLYLSQYFKLCFSLQITVQEFLNNFLASSYSLLIQLL